jgi:hypothetical protein
MTAVVVFVVAVSFVATLVRSTFGFGESLVAVPLFVLVMPVEVAVPLSVLVSIVVALVVVIQDRRSIHLGSATALVVCAALGIPIGLAALVYVDDHVVKIVLGGVIVGYSIYSLISKRTFQLERDDRRWLFGCGLVSGILGGAYGLNGPPLVVYGNLRRWGAEQFRATLQAYFLPVSVLGFAGYASQGLATATVARYFLFCLPAIVPAIFLGRYFNRRLGRAQFYTYVYLGLVVVGAVLVAVTAAE